jgi:iron complex outermembrane recepter protein
VMRWERQRITGTLANVKNGDVDNDPLTLYNNSYSYFDGSTRQLVPGGVGELSRTSFTVGGNWTINRNFSAFARANRGYRMPDFDVWRGRAANEVKDPVESITQFELGLKTVTPLYSAFVTVYRNDLKNTQTQGFTNAGAQTLRPNSVTNGVEFEASVRPLPGLELAGTGTLQDATYNNFRSATFDYSGNQVERVPRTVLRLTPSYRFSTPVGTMRVFGTYSAVGKRFASEANTLALPAYQTLDAGLTLFAANGLEFRLTGTNLTNEVGLTEGNFRVPNATAGSDGVFIARPLFGRAFELSVGMTF